MTWAAVHLWGTRIGAVSLRPGDRGPAVFEYDGTFADRAAGIEPAPLLMKRGRGRYSFPDASERTFRGLPGMLVDSLPDRFGTSLLDRWFAENGRDPAQINIVERLLYIADRGMGALTFEPPRTMIDEAPVHVLDLDDLGRLADLALRRDEGLSAALRNVSDSQNALDLIRVGTSAGGARAKALVAEDAGGRFLPGHRVLPGPHRYWLLKFGDVESNADRDSKDPPGMTAVEYVYSLIAGRCGIRMPECRLLEGGDARHFMIERFDRISSGELTDRLHYASWCGLTHAHRDWPGAYGYEQLSLACRQLGLPQSDLEQVYRRAVFNIIGVNHDDHTKNTGFLMDRRGTWSLSPAFDLTYAFDPTGVWTREHQTSLNGKTTGHTLDDLLEFAPHCNLTKREARVIVDQAREAFTHWPALSGDNGVPGNLAAVITGMVERTGRQLFS